MSQGVALRTGHLSEFMDTNIGSEYSIVHPLILPRYYVFKSIGNIHQNSVLIAKGA